MFGVFSLYALQNITKVHVSGVVSGVLLIVSSVLNVGNLLPTVSVFVYETSMTALPVSVTLVVSIMLLRYTQVCGYLISSRTI